MKTSKIKRPPKIIIILFLVGLLITGIFLFFYVICKFREKYEVKENSTYTTIELKPIDDSKTVVYESEGVILTFNYSDVVNYLLEIDSEIQEAVELKQYIVEQGLLSNEIKINEIPNYYIADLIELRKVKVYDKESNEYVEEIEVEERNMYCGPLCGSGHKYYRTKSGNSPFLSIMLWIS